MLLLVEPRQQYAIAFGGRTCFRHSIANRDAANRNGRILLPIGLLLGIPLGVGVSFYLLSGIASATATVVMAPQSMVPVIGASGAIAGVLGAYFILYPRGSILTFFPPFFFRLPAVLYLIVWFAAQLFSGIASGAAGSLMGGVAWWAHVGGFLFGVAVGPIVVREPERRRVARR